MDKEEIEVVARAIAPLAWVAKDNGFDGEHKGCVESLRLAKAAIKAIDEHRENKELADIMKARQGNKKIRVNLEDL